MKKYISSAYKFGFVIALAAVAFVVPHQARAQYYPSYSGNYYSGNPCIYSCTSYYQQTYPNYYGTPAYNYGSNYGYGNNSYSNNNNYGYNYNCSYNYCYYSYPSYYYPTYSQPTYYYPQYYYSYRGW